MICEEIRGLIVRGLKAGLSIRDIDIYKIDQHLETCGECRSYHDDITKIWGELSAISVEAPTRNLSKKVVAAVSKTKDGPTNIVQSEKHRRFVRPRILPVFGGVAAAASLLIAVGIAVLHFTSEKPDPLVNTVPDSVSRIDIKTIRLVSGCYIACYPGAQVVVEEDTKDTSHVSLKEGKIWVSVAEGTDFSCNTPAGTVEALGTRFTIESQLQGGKEMDVNKGIQTFVKVAVMSGVVMFSSPQGELIAFAGEEVMAEEGDTPRKYAAKNQDLRYGKNLNTNYYGELYAGEGEEMLRLELLKDFDADDDGSISDDERDAALEWFNQQKERIAQQKENPGVSKRFSPTQQTLLKIELIEEYLQESEEYNKDGDDPLSDAEVEAILRSELLNDFDEDGDGSISDEERDTALKWLNQNKDGDSEPDSGKDKWYWKSHNKVKLIEEYLKQSKEFNKDGDDPLSDAEVEAILRRELLHAFDEDGDGSISDEERDTTLELFKQHKDGDGELTDKYYERGRKRPEEKKNFWTDLMNEENVELIEQYLKESKEFNKDDDVELEEIEEKSRKDGLKEDTKDNYYDSQEEKKDQHDKQKEEKKDNYYDSQEEKKDQHDEQKENKKTDLYKVR